MSEQPPNPSINPEQPQPSAQNERKRTIVFMTILSFICALILSLLASILAKPKEIAKDLDRSKQMMIAAKILDHKGHFLIQNAAGEYVPAQYLKDGILTPSDGERLATQDQLLSVYKYRIVPLLLSPKNELVSFQDAHINEEEYLANYRKTGYYKQPYKLLYKVIKNPSPQQEILTDEMMTGKGAVDGYVIPVNGFGLWDAIYGYLAIKPDGNTVTGITWYDQKETPGLGANIAESPWQNLFPGKKLFQEGSDGKTDFKSAPLGITVVKGKVNEVLGDSPKAKSAVDGMAGATLTGNGVNEAYKHVLQAYRPFLIKLHEQSEKSGGEK